jgi:hypothetical protein
MTRLLVGVAIVSGCVCFLGLEYVRFISLSQVTLQSIMPFAILGLPAGVGVWLIDTYEQPKSALELRMERLMAPYRPVR